MVVYQNPASSDDGMSVWGEGMPMRLYGSARHVLYDGQDQDLDVPVSGDDHSVLMSMSSEYETLDQVPDDPPSSRLMTDAAIEIFAQEQVHLIRT